MTRPALLSLCTILASSDLLPATFSVKYLSPFLLNTTYTLQRHLFAFERSQRQTGPCVRRVLHRCE